MGEAFIEDLFSAWLEQGPMVIQTVIEKRPWDFLKVVASVMPKDLNVTVRPLNELTDEQLLVQLRKLDERIKPHLAIAPMTKGVARKTKH